MLIENEIGMIDGTPNRAPNEGDQQMCAKIMLPRGGKMTQDKTSIMQMMPMGMQLAGQRVNHFCHQSA